MADPTTTPTAPAASTGLSDEEYRRRKAEIENARAGLAETRSHSPVHGERFDQMYADMDRRIAEQEAKLEAERWGGEIGRWREGFSHTRDLNDASGNRTTTGRRFDELSGLYTGETDRGMYDAGTQAAASMARRGLSDSGYSAGLQSDVLGQAALARASAREQAMKEAIGEGMNLSLGDLSALGMQSATEQAPVIAARDWAEQQYLAMIQAAQAERSSRRKALASLAQLAALYPTGGGSPAASLTDSPSYAGGLDVG
ncbi:MAG TPA: hypothetical protein VIU16_02945 [Gaiellaceae bacterium]